MNTQQHLSPSDLRFALAYNFGSEWDALSNEDKNLIIRDCTEDGGVADIQQYRRNIGAGNLASYVRTQSVRFATKSARATVSRPLTGKKLDSAIARIYSRYGHGVQVNILDIPDIFDAAKAAYAVAHSEADIEASVLRSIEKYRRN